MIKTVKKNLTCLIISPDFFEKRDGNIKKKVKWEFSTLKLKVEKKKKNKISSKSHLFIHSGKHFHDLEILCVSSTFWYIHQEKSAREILALKEKCTCWGLSWFFSLQERKSLSGVKIPLNQLTILYAAKSFHLTWFENEEQLWLTIR